MQVPKRRYNKDGSRVWECDHCDCKTCQHYWNHDYEAPVCRFRRILCSVCKGRHAKMMCLNYKKLSDI